jgi:formamidopyrimidine-DNA glycosylase
MPELPEVETTLRGIAPHIEHQTIVEVIIREPRLRWLIPTNIKKILVGEIILKIERKGKYLLFKMRNGSLIIHLGMSGHLRILTKPLPPNKHDHVEIIFENKKILRFNDPRRFGAFLWTTEEPKNHPLLKNLGVEPLDKGFSGKYLWLKAQRRKTPIKSFLMNNNIVTGIGNIYATEVLFSTRIYPNTAVNLLSKKQMDILAISIKKILRSAIKRGGTTLRDFVNGDGKPGYFSSQLKVYGKAGLPCVICGNLLQSMQIAQRSTVYCSICQI